MTIDNIPNTAMVMTLEGQLKKLRADIIIAEGKQTDNVTRAEEISKQIAVKTAESRKLIEQCEVLDSERQELSKLNTKLMSETEKKREHFMKLQAKIKKASLIREQVKSLLADMDQGEKDALLTEIIFEANTVKNDGNYTLAREPQVDPEEEAFFSGGSDLPEAYDQFNFTDALPDTIEKQ